MGTAYQSVSAATCAATELLKLQQTQIFSPFVSSNQWENNGARGAWTIANAKNNIKHELIYNKCGRDAYLISWPSLWLQNVAIPKKTKTKKKTRKKQRPRSQELGECDSAQP